MRRVDTYLKNKTNKSLINLLINQELSLRDALSLYIYNFTDYEAVSKCMEKVHLQF